MVSAFIQYGRSEIHYLYFGTGHINILCLHGYGESAASFDFLHEYLPDTHNIIAIDLPFHGHTQWREERVFTKQDFVLVLEGIFNTLGIADRKFIMMGFSMGGRVALSMVEDIPESVSRLILLAPDGMKVNFWYWMATQTRVGNRLFRIMMNNPKSFLGLLQTAHRFKLINKSIFKFASAYITDEHVCKQLFQRWTCMRSFKPSPGKANTLIREKQIPVRILYGEHDRIILPESAGKFSNELGSLCQVHIIDAGHQLLQKKYGLIIKGLLS